MLLQAVDLFMRQLNTHHVHVYKSAQQTRSTATTQPAVIAVTGELFVLERGSTSLLPLPTVGGESGVTVEEAPVHARFAGSGEVAFDQGLQDTPRRKRERGGERKRGREGDREEDREQEREGEREGKRKGGREGERERGRKRRRKRGRERESGI